LNIDLVPFSNIEGSCLHARLLCMLQEVTHQLTTFGLFYYYDG
jgi:hypothetical protein